MSQHNLHFHNPEICQMFKTKGELKNPKQFRLIYLPIRFTIHLWVRKSNELPDRNCDKITFDPDFHCSAETKSLI